MKKMIIASALVLASGTAMASGGFDGPSQSGGFNGPSLAASSTVAEALEARDDSQVQLTGHITHYIGDEEYQFSDGQNNIVIEVDDRDWQGLSITPQDKITIIGEVDKDWKEVKIDVDRVQKAS